MCRNRSILVVDDEAALVQLCQIIFHDAGYAVRGATSGEEALQLIDQETPDVVLLDVMMPGMDGIEVCRRIRGDYGAHPRVLMYTADDQEKTRRNSLEAGADAVLNKMTPVFELPERIARYLPQGTGPLRPLSGVTPA